MSGERGLAGAQAGGQIPTGEQKHDQAKVQVDRFTNYGDDNGTASKYVTW